MTTTTFRPPLGVAVPDGWGLHTTLDLQSPEGDGITVHAFPAPSGADVGSLARRHVEALTTRHHVREVSLEPALLFGGRPSLIRRMEERTDAGDDRLLLVAYCVDAGFAYVALAAAAGRADGVALLEVLERATLEHPRMVERFSVEELLSAAALAGASGFAGVDPQALTGLDEDGRRLVLATAARTLVARQVAHLDAKGTVVLDDTWRARLEPAFRPALLVTVTQSRASEEPKTTTMAFVATGGVIARADGAGVVGVQTVPSTGLMDRLLEVADTTGDSTVRLRTMWRDEGRIRGGEISWTTGTASTTDRPELRERILGVLP